MRETEGSALPERNNPFNIILIIIMVFLSIMVIMCDAKSQIRDGVYLSEGRMCIHSEDTRSIHRRRSVANISDTLITIIEKEGYPPLELEVEKRKRTYNIRSFITVKGTTLIVFNREESSLKFVKINEKGIPMDTPFNIYYGLIYIEGITLQDVLDQYKE